MNNNNIGTMDDYDEDGEPNLIDSQLDDFDHNMMDEASINCPEE